jgi:L-fuconolactonase
MSLYRFKKNGGQAMIPIVDTHVHLWDIARLKYPWLQTVPTINRNFLIEDYAEASSHFEVQSMVVVQGECLPEQYREEIQFLSEQAALDPRIQGIVAYAPVENEREFDDALEFFSATDLVKGVRRMYDEDPALCCSRTFIRNLRWLPAFGLTFDVSVKPHALNHTIKMIEQCPETSFVLDHLGKPDIKGGDIATFRKHIDALAVLPNVKAKLSGLVTEADHNAWKKEDLIPYVTYAFEKFGAGRLMFGSDYPVVAQAASYKTWLTILLEILEGISAEDRRTVFYDNAISCYRLGSQESLK